MIKRFLGGVGLLMLTVAGAEAGCRTAPFRFDLGQANTTQATTTFSHGVEDCILGVRGGSRRSETQFEPVTVASAPKNGTARPHGSGNGVIYTAKAGFKGSDSLTIRVCGTGNGGRGCANVAFAITVQ
jgi:hypothetical protein